MIAFHEKGFFALLKRYFTSSCQEKRDLVAYAHHVVTLIHSY